MPEKSEQLFVKSHVARDLLQTAGLFKNERSAVWEYVANSLQYTDLPAVVTVTLDSRSKRIAVTDNGSGMNWDGLRNFFVMHGENQDRKAGRPGRGRFGTGKSAAFGIANILRIITVRNGKRSSVELSRDEVQAMTSGDEIPVRVLEREVRTAQANGTTVEIDQIHLRGLDQAGIIKYIERHLSRWPKNATVLVNNHECEVSDPPISSEHIFQPQGALLQTLGPVQLVVKVSRTPLEDDLRGVAIFSNGIWHETTLAGSEGREMCQYIFGEIDVQKLDEDESPVCPFDVSRSMKLNPSNELVRAIYTFISINVEQVRRELVENERRRRATEESKKLATQALEIAKVINDDFEEFRNRIAKVKARGGQGQDIFRSQPGGGQEPTVVAPGDAIPAEEVSPIGNPGAAGGAGGNCQEPRLLGPVLTPMDPPGEKKGRPIGGNTADRRFRGGFHVEFHNMGAESKRAQYASKERTIYINLDHPQLSAAKGAGSVDDPIFRRLVYEVAFCEYAIALAMELAQIEGNYIELTDPIVDISETLNRVARKGASLYATTT